MRLSCSVLALTLLFAVSPSEAKPEAYKCKILAAHHLRDSGKLGGDTIYKSVVGHEIIIDRLSGRAKGGIGNANANGVPQILDPGSHAQSYKAITVFRPFVSVDYLEVME